MLCPILFNPKNRTMEKDVILSKMLKYSAMQNGLCAQWTNEWNDETSLDELISKFKRGLDFCIEHNWPSKEFVDDNFDKKELARHHVYSNVEGISEWGFSDVATIVQHGSTGEFHFAGYDATTLWVRHDSEVLVTVSGNAIVFVHVYDNAVVNIEQHGSGKVTVKCHSKDAVVTTIGVVKYIEKQN